MALVVRSLPIFTTTKNCLFFRKHKMCLWLSTNVRVMFVLYEGISCEIVHDLFLIIIKENRWKTIHWFRLADNENNSIEESLNTWFAGRCNVVTWFVLIYRRVCYEVFLIVIDMKSSQKSHSIHQNLRNVRKSIGMTKTTNPTVQFDQEANVSDVSITNTTHIYQRFSKNIQRRLGI